MALYGVYMGLIGACPFGMMQGKFLRRCKVPKDEDGNFFTFEVLTHHHITSHTQLCIPMGRGGEAGLGGGERMEGKAAWGGARGCRG